MEKYHGENIEYWKDKADEDYYKTPISALKYIAVLEMKIDRLLDEINSTHLRT